MPWFKNPIGDGGNAPKETLKIYFIANSFAEDIANWAEDIAASLGMNVILGVMYRGGESLEGHMTQANGDLSSYIYYKRTSIDGKASTTQRNNTSLSYSIPDEDWDLIFFQQASHFSGMYETFQPFLNDLRSYVAERATNPHVKYGFHMTWAYATESTHWGFSNYNNNQIQMYEAICKAYQQAMIETGIRILIPSGTVIQNARSNETFKNHVGNDFTRDGYHLDLEESRFMVALGLIEVLSKEFYDESVYEKVIYMPEGVSNYAGFMAKVAVRNALGNPFKVTEI